MKKVLFFTNIEYAAIKKASIVDDLTNLTHLQMLSLTLLFILLPYLFSLDMLIILTPTTNTYSLI